MPLVKRSLLWFTCLALATPLALHAQTPTYALEDLGTLPGYRDVVPNAVAAYTGEVVGFAYDHQTPDTPAILYRHGRWTNLNPLFGPPNVLVSAQAAALNGFGKVAGWFTAGNGAPTGFILRRSGALTTFQAFGSPTTVGAINLRGQVVGRYAPEPGENRFFLRRPGGEVIDLGTFGLPDASLKGFNDAGQLLLVDEFRTVVASVSGATRPLGTLGGVATVGLALNQWGQVVGWSNTADGALHALLDDGASMHDLGTLAGGFFSEANAINDLGLIVGQGDAPNDPQGFSHGWVYCAGRMSDLNELTQPTPEHWTIVAANGVSAFGQLFCLATNPSLTTTITYQDPGGVTHTTTFPDYHVVKLTPVHGARTLR
jgi:probable HAF family extracellular repeat protein